VAEMNKRVNRYMAACSDDKFQAFKALIPWPVTPQRGRRAKSPAAEFQAEQERKAA